MKHWLAIYDIRNEKRLRKIAKIIESYGERVQKSVFEIIASEKTINCLRSKIRRIMKKEDFVVYFDICEKDWYKQIKHGHHKFKVMEEKEFYVL